MTDDGGRWRNSGAEGVEAMDRFAEPRMTGVWEIESGPDRISDETGAAMLRVLRLITEAIPADSPLHGMTVELGDFRWRFRRLGVLTLLEGPDGGYAVLNQDVSS